MLIKLDNPSLLSKAIEIIAELVTEVRIKVNELGFSITAIDPANVAMVGFRLPKNAFSQFEADNEVLGVNLEDLKRILRRCAGGGSLIMEKKENLLKIQIQDRIRRSFSLNLLDIEGEEMDFISKIARMDFVSHIEMGSADWIDSIEDCSVVSDACSFAIESGKFIIEAKGLNSAKTEFSADEAKINGENCRAKYSLEYLQKFIKGGKLSDKTIIKFSNDHPLRLEFNGEHMELNFILAPRVETDD